MARTASPSLKALPLKLKYVVVQREPPLLRSALQFYAGVVRERLFSHSEVLVGDHKQLPPTSCRRLLFCGHAASLGRETGRRRLPVAELHCQYSKCQVFGAAADPGGTGAEGRKLEEALCKYCSLQVLCIIAV